MGGEPWEPKWIPSWEGTHRRGNPWEPWEGVPDPPWEGNPWEPKGSHGRGPLGPPVEPLNGNAHSMGTPSKWERHSIKWERPVTGNAITLNGNAMTLDF